MWARFRARAVFRQFFYVGALSRAGGFPAVFLWAYQWYDGGMLKRACLLALFVLLPSVALAEGWTTYKSDTGAFTTLFPSDKKISRAFVRLEDANAAFSEEMSAVLDQRPYRNTVKRYVLKLDQTIGPALTKEEIEVLLDNEVETYKQYYAPMGGVLNDLKKGNFAGYPGREIYISYNDPEFGPQGIRAVFALTDVSKVAQIIMGSDDTIYAYKTKDYFASLGLWRGLSKVADGKFATGWKPYTVPSQIFTVDLPPVNPPFVLSDPKLAVKGRSEIITDIFSDPVRQQKIFYTVTSHKFTAPLTFKDAEQVILSEHLNKYKISMRGLQFARNPDGKVPVITLESAIVPPNDRPYANYVRLRAYFYGPYMIVQEMVGSATLVRSEFINYTMAQIEFHPQKAAGPAAPPIEPAAELEPKPATTAAP